jgi:hypothetical protein
MIQLDSQGYPMFLDMPVPLWLEREATQAVEMCPALALKLAAGDSWMREAPRPAISSSQPTGLLLSSSSAPRGRSATPPRSGST